uniref:Uncharacterized protein n=1 Tax=Knipowitschia caucasica TaxID=637954 RepID=A0AAV2J1B4_KNICA
MPATREGLALVSAPERVHVAGWRLVDLWGPEPGPGTDFGLGSGLCGDRGERGGPACARLLPESVVTICPLGTGATSRCSRGREGLTGLGRRFGKVREWSACCGGLRTRRGAAESAQSCACTGSTLRPPWPPQKPQTPHRHRACVKRAD